MNSRIVQTVSKILPQAAKRTEGSALITAQLEIVQYTKFPIKKYIKSKPLTFITV